MKENELKRWLKRKVRVTLGLIVAFFITGTIGYADPAVTPTVEELQKEIVKKNVELEKKNKEIEKKNKEIEKKNKEIETYFKSKAIIIGKNAKIGNQTLPQENLLGIAIGEEATIDAQGGNQGVYSIAIGRKARVGSNGIDFSSVAIGDGAYVLNGSGLQESVLSFDSDNWEIKNSSDWKKRIAKIKDVKVKDQKKVPGGIAIGTEAYARTGSIQIGAHTYAGIMGGVNIDNVKTNREGNIVNMTTIGTNSYQKAANGTIVGSYNISTGKFTGEGRLNSLNYGAQNFGASIFGTLNSIRSSGYDGKSGVANSIIGLANIAEDANGTLIYGAGNKVIHSSGDLKFDVNRAFSKNVDEAVKLFQESVKESNSGGATLVIGGGNEAEYTKQVTMIGTNNVVKGKSNYDKSSLIMLAGHNNNISNSSEVIAYGNNFNVIGSNNILFGFNANKNEVKNKKVVAIGDNIKVNDDYSVYLGDRSGAPDVNGSIWSMLKAEKEKINEEIKEKVKEKDNQIKEVEEALEIPGQDEEQKSKLRKRKAELKREKNKIEKEKKNADKNAREKYKEYADFAGFNEIEGIVSVGNKNLTRVIQNVAPGLISATSTDAINGSQLYHFINKGITIKDGKGSETVVRLGDTLTLRGDTIKVEHKETKAITPTPTPNSKPTPAPAPTPSKPVDNSKLKEELTGIIEQKEHTITFEIAKKLNESDEKLKKVDKKADLALGGISNAVAMANLVQLNSYSRHRHNLSAAYGYYGGSHALAIGFSGTNEKRNFIYKLSGAVNNHGNLALGIGAGIMLGNTEDDYPAKGDRIENLEKENKELKSEVQILKNQIKELYKIIKK